MEAQLIRRTKVPNAFAVGKRLGGPKVHLTTTGRLYLSVQAAAALGDKDCRVIVEHDAERRTLKFTVPEKLPEGVTEEDTFPVQIRFNDGCKKPLGTMAVTALLKYIGFHRNGILKPQKFEIVALDAEHRSLTVALPQCDSSDSSH